MRIIPESPPPIRPTPNFFLVGAPKAGSTSLNHYLDQHPQIYMSPIKEPHYFADEIRPDNFDDEMRCLTEPGLAALREYLQGPASAKFSGGPVTEWRDYLKLFQHVNGETAIGEASVGYLWSKDRNQEHCRTIPGSENSHGLARSNREDLFSIPAPAEHCKILRFFSRRGGCQPARDEHKARKAVSIS